MIAVLFEVTPKSEHGGTYFDVAAQLRPLVESIDGFLSIERFASVTNPGRFLSLSFWRDEAAIRAWREQQAHRDAQARGREELFLDYRIRVAQVVRDYGMGSPSSERNGAR